MRTYLILQQQTDQNSGCRGEARHGLVRPVRTPTKPGIQQREIYRRKQAIYLHLRTCYQIKQNIPPPFPDIVLFSPVFIYLDGKRAVHRDSTTEARKKEKKTKKKTPLYPIILFYPPILSRPGVKRAIQKKKSRALRHPLLPAK